MNIIIRLDRDETLAERCNREQTSMTFRYDITDGVWAQITYQAVRDQNGHILVEWEEKECCWWYDDQPWSDVVIEFVDDDELAARLERVPEDTDVPEGITLPVTNIAGMQALGAFDAAAADRFPGYPFGPGNIDGRGNP